jgi:hypothetical protein
MQCGKWGTIGGQFFPEWRILFHKVLLFWTLLDMLHWKFEQIFLVLLNFTFEEESPIVYCRMIAQCKKGRTTLQMIYLFIAVSRR